MSTITVKTTTQFYQNYKSTLTYLCECIIVHRYGLLMYTLLTYIISLRVDVWAHKPSLTPFSIEVPEPIQES